MCKSNAISQTQNEKEFHCFQLFEMNNNTLRLAKRCKVASTLRCLHQNVKWLKK